MELDEALQGAREGDEASFLALWTAYQPQLLRYLRVIAGADCEDVASETWLRVVRDLNRFRGESSQFAAWLFTIARRRALDTHRARTRRPLVLVGLNDALAAQAPVDRAGEHEAMERISTRQALALIATLPPDQAETVALNVITGMDAPTIAKIVGASPGAVRVRLHRGLRSLAKTLSQHPESQLQEVTA